ncbi:Homeobox-leucine zipper protein [Arachis hypogaea]|nr:Homeobox-leucine zipper protein [Arachis hypogaea]
MTMENQDLGLSLSLSFPQQQLNLIPSPYKTPSWNNQPFNSSDNRDSETCRGSAEGGSFLLRGIDVNSLPSGVDCEDDAGVSSPNSTVSSVSGKRSSEREQNNAEDHDTERASSRGISDEEDGETSRKKLRLSKDQSAVLEESFKEHNTLNPKQKLALAKQLGLRARQVEVWFQNRRARLVFHTFFHLFYLFIYHFIYLRFISFFRTKLKQTEVDCEFLKRCCENLTEENRRLQKEVQELRALKLSPQFYMQMSPPTTLTMCPSCERVAVPPSAVDPATRHHQMPQPHHHTRPIPIGPWAAAPPVFRPRS